MPRAGLGLGVVDRNDELGRHMPTRQYPVHGGTCENDASLDRVLQSNLDLDRTIALQPTAIPIGPVPLVGNGKIPNCPTLHVALLVAPHRPMVRSFWNLMGQMGTPAKAAFLSGLTWSAQ